MHILKLYFQGSFLQHVVLKKIGGKLGKWMALPLDL